jgi:hypothetical protein
LEGKELAKESYGGALLAVSGTEKEQDCAAEGYWYETKGYRKIPGDMCTGGVDLEPVKHACNGMTAVFGTGGPFKSLVTLALIGAILYYGWPIIEQILLMLPIPDPANSINTVKSYAGAAGEMVTNVMSTPSRRDTGMSASAAGYSGGLDNAPESFLENDEDSSDEEAGKKKPADDKIKLSYDSDDKNDDESVPISEPGSSELIDLGGSSGNESTSSGAAKLIPKLAGPK